MTETEDCIWDTALSIESDNGIIYYTTDFLVKGNGAKIRTLAANLVNFSGYSDYEYYNSSYKKNYAGKSCLVTDFYNDKIYINFSDSGLKNPSINICPVYPIGESQTGYGPIGFKLTKEEASKGSIALTMEEMLERCQYYDNGEAILEEYADGRNCYGAWVIAIGESTTDETYIGLEWDYIIDGDSYSLIMLDSKFQGENGFSYAEPASVNVNYRVHRQTYGWENEWKQNGVSSGTVGEGKRLEGIEIKLDTKADLGVEYRTHIQSYGWEKEWKSDGQMSGTEGEAKRLEAIQIRLTGNESLVSQYNVWYRVHAQSYGWLGWVCNGASAGTAGYGKRLEAIQVLVLPASETPQDGYLFGGFIDYAKKPTASQNYIVSYMTHVQGYGDQAYVGDGTVSGTFGEARRLEGIRINLNKEQLHASMIGDIQYRTHVQTYGWLDWSSNGAFNGTSGEGKRLEAIEIKLTDDLAQYYDVYYRVHAQTFGWLGWAKNGASAGTKGYAKRLEGIQILILPKGSAAPGYLPGTEGTASFIENIN